MNASRLVDMTPDKMAGESVTKVNRNQIKNLFCIEKVLLERKTREEEAAAVKAIKDEIRAIEAEPEEEEDNPMAKSVF